MFDQYGDALHGDLRKRLRKVNDESGRMARWVAGFGLRISGGEGRRVLRSFAFPAVIACTISAGVVAEDAASPLEIYRQRVESVRRIPGLVAFWDFVLREDGLAGGGRFLAYTAAGDSHRYLLEPRNITRDYWHQGRQATMADFPLLGRGPFGEAVHFRASEDLSHLPVLQVPRTVLHNTPLDVKGTGRSVSMVVWLIHQEGNHAIAGIWHEGTTTPRGEPAVIREKGRRQYALFAGMGGNPGAVGAHLSENGLGSFGDIYARHLAVTPEKMRSVPQDADDRLLDSGWSAAGFVYDADSQVVTAYLDGTATERWVDRPANDRFYRAAERAWRQAQLARLPGLQEGEEPDFPADQYYDPPHGQPIFEQVITETAEERTVLSQYEFTKVAATYRRNLDGEWGGPVRLELVALKTNPYWLGHSLYSPPAVEDGGPFSIGRVIHSGRGGRLTAHIGGVAVYQRALSQEEMVRLAKVAVGPEGSTLLYKDAMVDGLAAENQ